MTTRDPTAPTDAPPTLTAIEEAVGSPLVSSEENEYASASDASGEETHVPSEDNFEPAHYRLKVKEEDEEKKEAEGSPQDDTISNIAGTIATARLEPLSCALSGQSPPIDPVITPAGYLCSRQVLLARLNETGGIDPFDPDRMCTLDESQLISVKSGRDAAMPADAPPDPPVMCETPSPACSAESDAPRSQPTQPTSSSMPKRYKDRMVWGDYIGEYNELGERHGRGIIKYENGNFYDGGWRSDEKDGNGKYEFPNGALLIGEFKRNTAEGQGTLTFPNGRTYEGEFRGGKREGKGTERYQNGDVYRGDWRGGKEEGRGEYTAASGNVYDGEWRNGKWEGRGNVKFANGDSYDGEWRNGQMEGKGTIVFRDGRKYCGEFRGNKFDGSGTYTFADGRVEISQHRAGVCIGKGARWSSDRKKAWRIHGGKASFFARIRLKKAAAIAERLGLPVPE